jgi:polysaccharide deacetylase 2 family uncharacterized protein YibQ
VDAASDDLLKPLGVDRRQARKLPIRLPDGRFLSGALVAALSALVLYVAVVDDPLGGEPHAIAPIEMRPPAGPVADRPGNSSQIRDLAADPQGRSNATEIEAASGVSVVRPNGASAPTSVVIRVPDAAPAKLAPAPDRRLIERTRYGILPKVGPDGVRPAQVYARPAGTLPGGAQPAARIAILVGGLGISQSTTADAIAKLPPAVTLAFAPYGSDLDRQVGRARDEGHEAMLQAPMEPFDYPDNDPGPHTLTARARGQENIERLHWVMGRFAGYAGVVNFMGARLTSDEAALAPILREIGTRGLVFLDDGTSPRSVAATVGPTVGTPSARADVVIDALPRGDSIDKELERLERIARERGLAIGTASALPVSVDRIARWASELEGRGILLVPVSSAFRQEKSR